MTAVWYVVRFTITPSPVVHMLWRANHSDTVFFGCQVMGTVKPVKPCRHDPIITCLECMARWLPVSPWVSPLPLISRRV